jgi:hypothetical protein
MINPGSRPVEGGTIADAEANMAVFLRDATARGLRLAGDPERDPGADADGRFGWILPVEGGGRVPVLMPGAGLAQVRDDLTAQAYCIRVRADFWWWQDAAAMVVPLDPGRPTP